MKKKERKLQQAHHTSTFRMRVVCQFNPLLHQNRLLLLCCYHGRVSVYTYPVCLEVIAVAREHHLALFPPPTSTYGQKKQEQTKRPSTIIIQKTVNYTPGLLRIQEEKMRDSNSGESNNGAFLCKCLWYDKEACLRSSLRTHQYIIYFEHTIVIFFTPAPRLLFIIYISRIDTHACSVRSCYPLLFEY